MKWLAYLMCLVLLLLFAADALAVTIPTVSVGNPGNAPDTRYNSITVGSVAYSYQIGKYEVTAGQYTEFLNAVAKADANNLYNPLMGSTSFGANIQRMGSPSNFSYSVAADWANRPVNFVSVWDAARFANWLHNGQPTGAQGPGTTEGGAYLNIGNELTFARQPGAKFFIPSENEWYKAAYHQNDGVTGNYWDYPTASDTVPTNTLPDPGNHANFYDFYGTGNNGATIGGPYFRTEVGAFANSASPYGTFDQGGNLWEWSETLIDSSRGVRGGGFYGSSVDLHASLRDFYAPFYEGDHIGFRVASIAVPEPSTLLLLCIGSLAVLWRRRRLVCVLILVAAGWFSSVERAAADMFGSGTNTFDIEFVNFGNPNNVADTTGNPNPAGSVPYAYRMGKFETSEQMIDKASMVGGLGITKGTRIMADARQRAR